MDVHIPRPITSALRLHSIDVLTAQEDGAAGFSDPQLLDRSAELGRVLVTADKHFLSEAVCRQKEGIPFPGVVFVHLSETSIGRCIRNLEIYALAGDPADFANRLEYLES